MSIIPHTEQMTALGRAIEHDSFAIVDKEANDHHFDKHHWEIVRRVIHATADFQFLSTMAFSPHALDIGLSALKGGCHIVVDVQMIAAGLNAQRLGVYGCCVHHFIADNDVIEQAKKNATTRAVEAIRKAHKRGLLKGSIVAIGNAPTALLELLRKDYQPALIIGVPVGFVSAESSKKMLHQTKQNFITALGRKGGTTVAVAIVHGLLTLCERSLKKS